MLDVWLCVCITFSNLFSFLTPTPSLVPNRLGFSLNVFLPDYTLQIDLRFLYIHITRASNRFHRKSISIYMGAFHRISERYKCKLCVNFGILHSFPPTSIASFTIHNIIIFFSYFAVRRCFVCCYCWLGCLAQDSKILSRAVSRHFGMRLAIYNELYS